METNRVEMLDALKRLAPAISKRDLVPVFSCVCFDGKLAHAFDDVIGIEVPYKFEHPGAYRAETLLNWLSACSAMTVTAEKDEESSVAFKCGRSRIVVPMLGTDSFVFEPKPPKRAFVVDKEQGIDDFLKRLEVCLPATAQDATYPWAFGVTVQWTKKTVIFYATNNFVAARTTMKRRDPNGPERLVLLPPRFCTLLIEANRRDKVRSVSIGDDRLLAEFESGMRVHCKLGMEPSLKSYNALYSPEFMAMVASKQQPSPKGLAAALNRCCLVLDKAAAHTVGFRIENERLYLTGKSSIGAINDVLKFPGHPEVKGAFDPIHMTPIAPKFSRICVIDERCFVAEVEEGGTFLFSLVVVNE